MKEISCSKRIMIFVFSIFGGIFFLQGCIAARWARSMADMSCMGMMMGGHGAMKKKRAPWLWPISANPLFI